MQDTQKEKNTFISLDSVFQSTQIKDPLQKLKELTDREINRLNNERRTMQEAHSNLDLLLKRYNLEKSYFSQISNWYGSKAWWVKILLFILLVAISVGVGFLCHAPITFVSITAASYMFFAFFFINHYKITQQQTQRLCEDIIELEKTLHETIKHFNDLSNSLNLIMISSHELNAQMLNETQSLQENIKILNEQIEKYKLIIDDLTVVKESLINTTTKVKENLSTGDKQYQECSIILKDQSSQIISVCDSIKISQESLKNDSQELLDMIDKYQNATTKIYEATNIMQNIITNFNNDQKVLINKNQTTAENDVYYDEELSKLNFNTCENSNSISEKILEEAKQTHINTHEILKRIHIEKYISNTLM